MFLETGELGWAEPLVTPPLLNSSKNTRGLLFLELKICGFFFDCSPLLTLAVAVYGALLHEKLGACVNRNQLVFQSF
jgi:hypothetical protein